MCARRDRINVKRVVQMSLCPYDPNFVYQNREDGPASELGGPPGNVGNLLPPRFAGTCRDAAPGTDGNGDDEPTRSAAALGRGGGGGRSLARTTRIGLSSFTGMGGGGGGKFLVAVLTVLYVDLGVGGIGSSSCSSAMLCSVTAVLGP